MADRYVAAHKTPKGPGDARPTALQIIQDESLEGQWSEKTVFITGCSSGIGVESARALYKTGATLFLTARNLAKAKSALGDLAESPRVTLLELDLESLDSVRSCAKEFLSRSQKLNILICNAGVMTPPEGRTKDGFETQFGTNHLSHFLLINLLLPTLTSSATPTFSSRVVVLASIAHRFGEVNFDNYNFDGNYDALAAYAASKTANVWSANEIERRYKDKGVHAWSVQPGSVLTDLARHFSDEAKAGFASDPYLVTITKNPDQGAATSIWAATSSALEGQGGKYLEDCQIIGKWDPTVGQWSPGYGNHTYDEAKAQKLWDLSLKLVGL